jgi:hypothetical protein
MPRDPAESVVNEYWLTAIGIILFGSLTCAILGYLIGVKQMRHLLSGWDESKVAHPEAYAALVGKSLVLMSIALGLVAVSWAGGALSEGMFVVLMVLVSLLPAAALLVARSKYGRR